MRGIVFAITGLALLAACWREDKRICQEVSTTSLPVDQCIHREGYKLAGAPGSAAQVAEGVVGACDSTIIQSSMDLGLKAGVRAEGMDAWLAEAETNAKKAAIRRVIEARAGNCDIPSDEFG